MKRTLFSLFLLIFCVLQGFAQGWNDRMWTGITGPVLSASTNTEVMNFTNEGFYNYVQINYAWFKLETWDLNHTEGMIFGSCYIDGYEDSYSMRIDGGRLTSISVGEYDDYLIEFSYNNLGQPTQVVMTEVHEGSMVCILKYSNYKTDAYGNWISRSVSERQETYDWWSGNNKKKVKTKNYTEKRSLTYIEGFCEWNNAWPSVKANGNLSKIEQFITSPLSAENIRTEARSCWNREVLENAKAGKYTSQKILEYANMPIASSVVDQLYKIARQKIFEEEVMKETHYIEVQKYVNMEYANRDVFDDEYKQKIRSRAQELRAKSIESLTESVQQAFKNGDYNKVVDDCNKLLAIEPNSEETRRMLMEGEYKLLIEKANNTGINVAVCESFLHRYSSYTDSPYLVQIGDLMIKKVLSTSSDYDVHQYYSMLQKCSDVPMSQSVKQDYLTQLSKTTKLHLSAKENEERQKALEKEKVKKQRERSLKKEKNRANRGNFVGVTGGINMGFSRCEMFGGVEAGMRFGYRYQLLNLWAGAKYELNSGYMMASVEEPAGYLTCNTLDIPFVLRLNLSRSYTFDFFMGLGAEYSMPLKGRYAVLVPGTKTDTEPAEYDRSSKSKDYVGGAFIAPRLSFGFSYKFAEAEIFGTYNLKHKYNADNLRAVGVPELIGNQFELQTKGKVNVGVALRFGF